MMRGLHTEAQTCSPETVTASGSRRLLAEEAGRSSVGADLAAENAMHNWQFLLSLVKAKLLNNNGRGRKITILCGGMLCVTYEQTLRRYPGTLLTSMITEEDGALFYSDKLMLDRHPLAFVEILNAYREGVIAEQPEHIAPETWIHELAYFRMHRAQIPSINRLLTKYGVHVQKSRDNNPLQDLPKWAEALYQLLEEPHSSWPAWILSFTSLSMILVAVTTVCIETMPEVRRNKKMVHQLFIVETIIIIFFTAEFLARLLVANNKKRFLTRPMNVIDVIAIAPFYVTLVLPAAAGWDLSKVLRILRVLRIFKLSRHSNGLQVLFETAKACQEELMLLLFCLLVFSLLFSALLFFAEQGQDQGFESKCRVQCVMRRLIECLRVCTVCSTHARTHAHTHTHTQTHTHRHTHTHTCESCIYTLCTTNILSYKASTQRAALDLADARL